MFIHQGKNKKEQIETLLINKWIDFSKLEILEVL